MKRQKAMGTLGNRGFTLVEMIVIIAIIGFLAAILTPNIVTRVLREKKYRAVESCKQAVSAAEQLYDESLTYKTNFSTDNIVQRAGMDGGTVKVEVVNDEIVHLYYKHGTESVVYCRYYDEVDANGKHIHSTLKDTSPYQCDGTTDENGKDVPAHTELYNFIDEVDAINYYDDKVADTVFDTDDGGSSIEFETDATTETTTNDGGGDSDSETTTKNPSGTDDSTETTTVASSGLFTFDPNKDYSFGGDGVERIFQFVVDQVNNMGNNWVWNQTTNQTDVIPTWDGDTLSYTGILDGGISVSIGNNLFPSGGSEKILVERVGSNMQFSSYKIGDTYYLIEKDRFPTSSINGLNLFDGNNGWMYVKGIGKVKQNPIYFYNKDANGNYIKTNAEDFKKNLEARLDYDSADSADFVKKLNRLYNSMSDEAASQSTSSSAAVIAVKLTNDKLCTRRYQKYNVDASGNPTSLVTYVDTYDGKTRAVETGDVYVDSSTGRMYVYCSPTGFGTGWFCMGYYPGYDYLSGTVSYPS